MNLPFLAGLCAVFLATSLGTAVAKDDAAAKQAGDPAPPKSIACAQETGEALGQCKYTIKRDEAGKTTVKVAFANGFKRQLFFKDGKFLKANATMSGTGTDTDWSVKDGTHRVRVDDQRYEVPGTLIAGD